MGQAASFWGPEQCHDGSRSLTEEELGIKSSLLVEDFKTLCWLYVLNFSNTPFFSILLS